MNQKVSLWQLRGNYGFRVSHPFSSVKAYKGNGWKRLFKIVNPLVGSSNLAPGDS